MLAFVKLYDRKNALVAAELVNDRAVPLRICVEYSSSPPADLIGSEVDRRAGKLFLVVADPR
jgi:hypothetical protein